MLVNIQCLRLVAASLVVLYHTAAWIRVDAGFATPIFSFGQAAGFAGVDVFFVISGFIMAHTTLAAQGGRAASEFARRRAARIYSGYWPFFALTLAVFQWARPEHFAESNLWNSFWLWPQPLNRNLLELSWTLSFEMYFYALFTLLVWFCPPRRRALVCAMALAALALFNGLRHFVLDGFGPEHLYAMTFWDAFLSSPFILEFLAGSLAAWWLHARPEGWRWRLLLPGAVLFVAGGWLNVSGWDGNIEQGYFVVPRVLLFGSASLLLVAGLVRLEQAGRSAPRAASLLGGGASYAIYLVHVPVLVAANQLGLGGWASQQSPAVVGFTYLGLVLGILLVSIVFYRFAERRLHRLFRRVLRVA